MNTTFIPVSYTTENLTGFNLVNAFVNRRVCKVKFESGLSQGSESSVNFYRKHGQKLLKIKLIPFDEGVSNKCILGIATDDGLGGLKTSRIKSISGNDRYIRIETENTVFHFYAPRENPVEEHVAER